MKTSGSLQEFLELITAHARRMSEAQKSEFRAAWLAHVAERERTRPPQHYIAELRGTEWVVTRFSDRRFLKSIGVDPDGD